MPTSSSTRSLIGRALMRLAGPLLGLGMVAAVVPPANCSPAAWARGAARPLRQPPPGARRPAPVERRAAPGASAAAAPNQTQRPAPGAAGRPSNIGSGEHLSQWIDSHHSMPLEQQQRALDQEPGFHNLPPDQQQRLHQRLAQLNNMSPVDRQKILDRNEYMERLIPAQRQQVRGAMAQLGGLPEPRQHLVARTFYSLRDLPPAQRQSYMASPQFRAQFNDQERSALNGLFAIAPLWPPLQARH